jgi:hypothetical protein
MFRIDKLTEAFVYDQHGNQICDVSMANFDINGETYILPKIKDMIKSRTKISYRSNNTKQKDYKNGKNSKI